ncbi:hypothetical protein [Pseudolactococcus yaeyamensis]
MKIEKDLEIKLSDGIIPELIKVDFQSLDFGDELYSLYANTSDYDEMLDIAREKYQVFTLDVFKETMESDDARLDLLSNEYFRLSQEDKYLKFIEKVFEANDRKAYVDFGNITNKQKLLEFMMKKSSQLDKIDTFILLSQINIVNSAENSVYAIEDLNILKLFLKGFLREILWNSIYFSKFPLILKSGYDLSLPIIFENKKNRDFYGQMAHDYELYFR